MKGDWMMSRGRWLVAMIGVLALLLSVGCEGPRAPGAIIVECAGGIDPDDWVSRAPLSLCMSANVRAGDAVLLYEWDFGDGTVGTGQNVVHTYVAVGDYFVTLTSTYSDGSVYEDHETVSVAGEPDATFIAREFDFWGSLFPWGRKDDVLTWRFDARDIYPRASGDSKYRAVQLVWDFGDGTTETEDLDPDAPLVGLFGNRMITDHTYATSGIYIVSLTLTDNLGTSDTTTQTITVGSPEDEDDEVIDQFTLTSSDWEIDDEEEDDCLAIYGSVMNNGPEDAGLELTATAYAGTVAVGSTTHWVAGVDYQYGFLLCDLSVPIEQVTQVDVVVTNAIVY